MSPWETESLLRRVDTPQTGRTVQQTYVYEALNPMNECLCISPTATMTTHMLGLHLSCPLVNQFELTIVRSATFYATIINVVNGYLILQMGL